ACKSEATAPSPRFHSPGDSSTTRTGSRPQAQAEPEAFAAGSLGFLEKSFLREVVGNHSLKCTNTKYSGRCCDKNPGISWRQCHSRCHHRHRCHQQQQSSATTIYRDDTATDDEVTFLLRIWSSKSLEASSIMLQHAARTWSRASRSLVCHAAMRPVAPAAIPATSVLASRCFAAAAKKPKMEDGTLEGRYATALFMASMDKLDKVYGDLQGLREMMESSQEFKLAIETPGIEPESKVAAFEAVCKKASIDGAVLNFLKVLVENKRAHLLSRMIDIFENFYRAEKNLVLCKVTSAASLSDGQKKQVQAAMQKRAEGSKLIMEYNTNPALLGGLVVKMDEAVLDNSVSTRLERLQTQLLAPV
ncbi:atpH, partial [Symbiodinium sp. CCMP2456]